MRTARNTVLALLVLLCACDPGYRYSPTGWAEGPKYWFSHQEPTFRLHVRSVGGLIGQTYLGVEGRIENLSSQPITFEQPELASGGITYFGRYYGKGRPQRLAVDAGGVHPLGVAFVFSEPLYKTLAEDLVFRLRYRIGSGELQQFEVKLQRHAS